MTAKGKVTTARLHEGSRIQVRLADGYPGKAYPSGNKSKGAHTLVVTSVGVNEATTMERRRTYNIHGTIDGKPYTIPRATGAQTFWIAPLPKEAHTRGYVALFHSVASKETMALHRAGCGDIERDRERHGSNLQAFEAADLEAALAIVVDDELTEMGYTPNDVRVYPCVTSTEPKEGNKMATATVTNIETKAAARKAAAKPAPASARKNGKAPATAKATTAKATTAKKAAAPKDGVNFDAKAIRNRIVKEHEAGSTIKEIAEGLGLPAEHRSWFRVSKVWREEADARGLKRPRRSKS